MPNSETAANGNAEAPAPQEWDEVLRFWFPDRSDDDLETHSRRWAWRMRGGADAEIVARFSGLTERAAEGALDHWAAEPKGRCALIVVLDQFSRSVFQSSPRAFAQDPRAAAIALEGLGNGHFAALANPWQQTIYQLALTHCEGPDHLARLDRAHAIAVEIQASAPEHLRPHYAFAVEQKVLHRRVIETFGRFPHRNAVLGRTSTPEEAEYVAQGQFPHRRPVPLGSPPESGQAG